MNLKMIFERLGVPTNETWPGIEESQIYQAVRAIVQNQGPGSQLRNYMQSKGVTDHLALDLLEKMLTMNPDKRITIRQILSHAYL